MASGPMHPDELHSDEGMVARLVAAQFPRWAALPVRRYDSAGTVNAIYRLGDELAARLPLRPGRDATLERVHRWLPRLAPRLPLETPEPLATGDPGEGFPERWCIHRWLEGEAPTPENVDLHQVAQALAAFILALRAQDGTDGPQPGPDNYGRGVPLARRDDATRRAIKASAGLVDVEAVTEAWEAALAAPAWDGAPTWLHGDLMPGNLLVRERRLVAVLDFGSLGLGDPACDLMVAWNLLTPDARQVFRREVAADDASWARGKGWALSQGVIALPYYRETNPRLAALAKRTIEAVIADRV
ncbi:MAG: aminoglycoside phosphotransferase family protein [Dehalococcoidia bacterium]|nr:aminoglycoside phosphotransferase family protein [Dehalococcoidia bacterium]